MGQFLTSKFKEHTPSRWRRETQSDCLTAYTIAMKGLLDHALGDLATIKELGKWQIVDKETGEVKGEKFTGKSIAQILPKPSSLAAPLSSSVKEALVQDVAGMLASHLSLDESESQAAGFPVCRDPYPDEYPDALAEFCTIGADLVAENEARYNLLRKVRSNTMPLPFTRSRDFALLISEDRSKFYLWMKLLPAGGLGGERRTTIREGNLINLATLEPFNYRGSSAILAPLELGRRGWQYEKFIRPVLAGEAKVKAGKLTKEGDDFYIHVSFEMPEVEAYEPKAYLGVNRGIINTAGWGVIDLKGNIIATGHSGDPFFEIKQRAMKRVQGKQKRFAKITQRDYARQELDNIIHSVVNDLLNVAREHQAALVLEDWSLTNAGKFYKSAYQKVSQIIDYKARLAGVPVLKRKIWSAFASQICIHCGVQELVREGRIVICSFCDRREHVDETNGVNIARRVLYKKEEWGGSKERAGNWRLFHQSFGGKIDN